MEGRDLPRGILVNGRRNQEASWSKNFQVRDGSEEEDVHGFEEEDDAKGDDAKGMRPWKPKGSGRDIIVVVPELEKSHWAEGVLHNMLI
jgi:hypothetical protein